MIPSFAVISWKPRQKIPVFIPILLLWPVIFLVLGIAWTVGFFLPSCREHSAKIRAMIVALMNMRGLRVEVASDETYFRIRVV